MSHSPTPSFSTPHSEPHEKNSSSVITESCWKQQLRHSYQTLEDLVRAGLLSETEATSLQSVGKEFKIRITPYYAQLIEARADCPIRLQAIPHIHEEEPKFPEWVKTWSQKLYQTDSPFRGDAIGDLRHLSTPRLTHRYEQRAILHLSSLCAMYCRFCFRKTHLNDQERTLYDGSLDPAFSYLEQHREIQELILTGGDPLSVTDEALARIFQRVSAIPHIKTLRIHSKMAVTLPSRLTSELRSLFSQDWNFQICLVSHFNHPKELTSLAREKLRALKKTGVTLLNQSVLLHQVNDSIPVLKDLFEGLYEIGVIPYYLHHPDWTAGTFHFRVSIEKGQALMRSLRGILSGPALPDYVLDIPGGYGKISLLDGSFCKKLQDLPNDPNHPFRGSIYEVLPPQTRSKISSAPVLYLDLCREPASATKA